MESALLGERRGEGVSVPETNAYQVNWPPANSTYAARQDASRNYALLIPTPMTDDVVAHRVMLNYAHRQIASGSLCMNRYTQWP